MDDYGYSNSTSQLYAKARPFLADAEEILWAAKPHISFLSCVNIPLLIFSIFWFGLLGSFVFTAILPGIVSGEWYTLLFCVPHFVAGFYILYLATIGRSVSLKNTFYFLTSTRIIVITVKHGSDNCFSKPWREISSLNLLRVQEGRGGIVFCDINVNVSYHQPNMSRSVRAGSGSSYTGTSFFNVENVHTAYNIAMNYINQ